MATRTFNTIVDYQRYMDSACKKAVENTCNRLLGTLQHLILSEYYDKFTPDYYKRTYQFYESAMMKMLNKAMGEIFMDANHMNYGNYWDGKTQLYMADAGYHGSSEIYEDGHFWKDFISFCNENAINILKEELNKQGISIK